MKGPGTDTEKDENLHLFPEQNVTSAELRRMLDEGTRADRVWVVSQLLRYAQWDDIWRFVTRDEVREVFAELELSENLREAWARMLKVGIEESGTGVGPKNR